MIMRQILKKMHLKRYERYFLILNNMAFRGKLLLLLALLKNV